jgi:putative endonuclease
MRSRYFVYILTNKYNKVLYTGVTNNLQRRTGEHKNKIHIKSFTSRYNVDKLVYYEIFTQIIPAIAREKQIKAGSRQKKIDLINSMNPEWGDLSEGFE